MSWYEINTYLRNPIRVKLISSRFLKTLLQFFLVIWVFSPIFPFLKSSLLYLIIFPVLTCLVHNCEISWRFYYFYLLSPLFCDQFPLIPISMCLRDPITMRVVLSEFLKILLQLLLVIWVFSPIFSLLQALFLIWSSSQCL